MSYTHLTLEQRYQISALLKVGCSQKMISETVGVHKSTICRELKRNKGGRGYRPLQAHRLARARQHAKCQPRIQAREWRQIEKYVREDWSPEQISLWFGLSGELSISHEWIYQHIYADRSSGGSLYKHLRCKKKRRKRYGRYEKRGKLLNRRGITERPAIVDRRTRLGDWEVDTIIGCNHKQAIVSLTERKSRLTLLAKVKYRKAEMVQKSIEFLLSPISESVHTITSDNGKEFANHMDIAEKLQCDFFFAEPYSPWQRGLNENANGLVRQYFPKKYDFSNISQSDIQKVMNKLNNRPRKCLGMKTPFQIFSKINNRVALVT